ncbi:MAG: hypoxanthine phosphoribosyltransferase [bacterium]|nr:hypoxanthine phosphoribosyltransferase [bacterium]
MKAKSYYKKLGKILIPSAKLQRKIREIAKQIEKDYRNDEVVFICNLKGSFRFLSDLVSYVRIPLNIDFISFTSYHGTDPGKIRIIKDLKTDIRNKNVIVVEDIADTGVTIDFIMKYLKDFKYPRDIRICALLDKVSKRKIDVTIHYRGFVIPDKFIVGYGLDYREYFRELNDIRIYNG